MLNGVRNILACVAGVKRGRDGDYFSHPCVPLALSHAPRALARSNSPFLFPHRLVAFSMGWYTVQQELQLLLIKKVKSCVTGYRYTQGLDCERVRSKERTIPFFVRLLLWFESYAQEQSTWFSPLQKMALSREVPRHGLRKTQGYITQQHWW